MSGIRLILSSAVGQYIPRAFAQMLLRGEHPALMPNGDNKEDVLKDLNFLLLNSLSDDGYWDAWNDVLNNYSVQEGEHTWTLHQDGDLFLVCPEKMTDREFGDFYEDEGQREDRAITSLRAKVAAGNEFPDALQKVCSDLHVSSNTIREMYDTETAE